MPNRLKQLQSGELRHIANIEKLIVAVGASGTPTQTYELWASDVRFSFADWRVTEGLQAKEITSSVLTYLTMRWRPGVIASMRVVHISDYTTSPATVDYYDVQGVVRDPNLREALQLACIKRDAAGYRTGVVP